MASSRRESIHASPPKAIAAPNAKRLTSAAAWGQFTRAMSPSQMCGKSVQRLRTDLPVASTV